MQRRPFQYSYSNIFHDKIEGLKFTNLERACINRGVCKNDVRNLILTYLTVNINRVN